MAPPAPALPKASQHTLYHAPASSAPPRAGAGFDLLPGFQLIIVYMGRDYSKQEVLMCLSAYAKSEDFHEKDRNRVAFASLPKSYSISPAALCPQEASLRCSIRPQSCQYLHTYLHLLRSVVLSQQSLCSQTSRMLFPVIRSRMCTSLLKIRTLMP